MLITSSFLASALKELVKTSPLPNEAEGTDNVQIFFASYVVGGASDAELKAFYDPLNSKGKYYDVEVKTVAPAPPKNPNP